MSSHGNKIRVTLERKADYNRVKGSKITAKHLFKTRTPLPVKAKGGGMQHPGSHLASEEDASREGASSGGPGLLKGAACYSRPALAAFWETQALLTYPIVCLDSIFSTGFTGFM